MCDVMGILGMGLSLAGSMMQAQQQQAYINAQNQANQQAFQIARKAREAERARQAEFTQQAEQNWQDTSAKLSRDQSDADRDTSADKFMAEYDTLPNQFKDDGYLLSGQNTASGEVQQAIAAKTSNAAADARKRVQALAQLTGYRDTDQLRAGGLQTGADFLSTLNGLRRGSLAVAQQEQSISPGVVSQGGGSMGGILSGVGGLVAKAGGYNSAVNG